MRPLEALRALGLWCGLCGDLTLDEPDDHRCAPSPPLQLQGMPGMTGQVTRADLEAEARAEIDAIEEAAGLRFRELTVPPFDPNPDLIDYSMMGKRAGQRFRREVEKDHEAAQRQRGRVW